MSPIAFVVDPINILKKFKTSDLMNFGTSNSEVSPEFLAFVEEHHIFQKEIPEGEPRIVIKGKTPSSTDSTIACFAYEGDKVEDKYIPPLKNVAEYYDDEDFYRAQKERSNALEEARKYTRKNGWKAFQDFFGKENLTKGKRTREGTIWKADKYKLKLKYQGTSRESNCFLIPAIEEEDIEVLDFDPITRFYDPDIEEELDDILEYMDILIKE